MTVPLLNASAMILEATKMRTTSLKSLIYDSYYMDKSRLSAVTMETQRHLPIIEKLIKESGAHESKGLSECLLRVVTYELLFGKGLGGRDGGGFRKAIRPYQRKMKDSLKKLKEDLGASTGKELLEKFGLTAREDPMPRWVRVNLLKTTVEEVEEMFVADGCICILSRKEADDLARGKDPKTISSLMDEYANSLGPWQFMSDLHLPDVLVFSPATPLFNHYLTEDKQIILMDKASCIPARVLAPPRDSHVIDSCAAPGNKTNHLSCLMQNTGKVFAFDMDKKRTGMLQRMMEKSDSTNVETQCADFLEVDPDDVKYSKVTHILVDPSCSGSGIVSRKDHLTGEVASRTRLKLLRGLQLRILNHAMRFPSVERVIYSTCSIHRAENEEVVWRILYANTEFELAMVLPSWHHRPTKMKLGVDEDKADEDGNEYHEQDVNYTYVRETMEQEIAEKCLRASFAVDKTNGFFVALFKRTSRNSLKQGEEHEVGGDVNDKCKDSESTGVDEVKEGEMDASKNDLGASTTSRKRQFSRSVDEEYNTSVKEEDSSIKRKKKKEKKKNKTKDEPFSSEVFSGDVKDFDNSLQDAKLTTTDDAVNDLDGVDGGERRKKKKKQKHKYENSDRSFHIDELPAAEWGNDNNGRKNEFKEKLSSTEVKENIRKNRENENNAMKSEDEEVQSQKKKKRKKKKKDINGFENQERGESVTANIELKQREDGASQRRKKTRRNKNLEEEAVEIAKCDDVEQTIEEGETKKKKKKRSKDDASVDDMEVVPKPEDNIGDELGAVGDYQRRRKKKKKRNKDVE